MNPKAKEIMTHPVISIKEDQTLEEAINLLAKQKFSGVPVVNDDNKVIGILSDSDIIRYSHQAKVIPFMDLSGWISPHTDISDLATVRKGIDMLSTTKAGEVMTKKVYTVREDADLTEVARLMNRRNINRVPVVDDEGRLIGIITRADMVRVMAN